MIVIKPDHTGIWYVYDYGKIIKTEIFYWSDKDVEEALKNDQNAKYRYDNGILYLGDIKYEKRNI